MQIKKTYFISNDIITGERYLVKSIEYDFQGNVKEFINYDWNGVQAYREMTERYKNHIASVTTLFKTEHTKYYYVYDEYIYDEKNLLTEKVSFGRLDFISKCDYYEEEDYERLWCPEKIIEHAYINICRYKYDDKNRLIRESYHTIEDDLVTTTEYFYNDDEKTMIKEFHHSDSELIIMIIPRSNDKQHRISNTYDKNGALQRAERTIFNPDGSKIIIQEMINDGKSKRNVYRYDKEGNLLEVNSFDDFVHTSTRRLNNFDQTGLMKGYSEYVTKKNTEKITTLIEYEFVHEYFPGD